MQPSQIKKDEIVSAIKNCSNSINSERKVVADISSLIDVTSQLPLSSFDFWERLIRSEFSLALRESTPPKWKIWSKSNELLTWLDLVSWDGHRREKSLRALSGAAPNTFFFSLAVRRLNDWVPQVRAAAGEKLPEIAKATDPRYVVEALCIALSNWTSWGRIEEAGKKVLLQIICEKEIADSLRFKLISSTSGPMPSLFSQLGRTPILDGYVNEIASLAIQPSVRAKAYRSLFEGRIAWVEGRKWEWTDKSYGEGRLKPVVAERKLDVQTPLYDLIKKSSEDRSSIVRRISAEILIRELENLGSVAWELAEQFISDKSHPVSERGRFAVRKLEEAERANAS
ncbi:hypothetical protein CWE12_01290 [Aliidiomarina sedimenti]|uniref:HEAT repeat domain-containing protein n=1 Tax=Aliidiomarina sedimenti TaxID=1933879 RepID=A0ABY0C2E6_9GAMM|nr:hypothetical protein [Aliidiomarina sedimenti]RUO31660.1 hypothetical protein CWE12_01290 [Aliidiomarina sedimenti]